MNEIGGLVLAFSRPWINRMCLYRLWLVELRFRMSGYLVTLSFDVKSQHLEHALNLFSLSNAPEVCKA